MGVKNSDDSSGNESDSSNSEEPHVVLKGENSVPTMDDENFPPLSNGNLKSEVEKIEISDQFFSDKKEFDAVKAFNGNVLHIFGKMADGKVKGGKEFYESKILKPNEDG
ncbi:hypothetical protein Hanom_Chr09g00796181 [Helianthus anomalus]